MEFIDYFNIIKKRLWLIILCVLISTVITAFYTNYNYQPVYQASTKLIVNKTEDLDQLGQEQMDFGAMAFNIKLIETYKEIIKTPAIMDKVVQRYPDLNITTGQLISTVNVFALNETQVMTIEMTDSSYERAAIIVNAVFEVFQAEIPKIMKVDNITILNSANVADTPPPINAKTNQNIVLSFAISLIFAIGIAFLLEFLDDTIKTENDIHRELELPTLSLIIRTEQKRIRSSKKKKSRENVGESQYAAINR